MPTISVIVPVYKVEPYLRCCVDSILTQTFTDFELILVDDGSPDNCGAICDEYAEKDSRVHVIHKENGGLSSARNAGLEIANGDYVYFCDGDDYITETLLEDAIEFLPLYDMVVFNYQKVDEAGRSLGQQSNFHSTITAFDNVGQRNRFCKAHSFFTIPSVGKRVSAFFGRALLISILCHLQITELFLQRICIFAFAI